MNRNDNQHPYIIALARSPVELALELAGLVGILCSFAIVFQSWGHLPEEIPIHFGLIGNADSWGSKSILWLLPSVGTFIYLILTVSPFLSYLFNYPIPIPEEIAGRLWQIVRELFAWMKVQIVWLFFFIDWQIIQVGLGEAQTMATASIFTALLFLGGTIWFYYQQADEIG